MLLGKQGFGISPDSLVNWIGAFLWGPWPSAGVVWTSLACVLVGMFGSLDILLVGSLIVLKKKKIFLRVSMPF